MMKTALLGFMLLITLVRSQEMGGKKVVCYYTSWSVYRTNQYVFRPNQIDPFLCTHIVYAFGAFERGDNIKPFDYFQDIVKGGYRDVTNIKSVNKEVKVLLGFGGGREGSKNFSPIAASAQRRAGFSAALAQYLRMHDFDGLSLDWQHPAFNEGKPEDRENYVLLVESIKYEFVKESLAGNRSQLLISLTAPSREEHLERGYNLQRLQEFVDLVNLAAYDYHHPYEPTVYHHSALYPLPDETEGHYNRNLNVAGTLKYLLSKGADLSKYTLGIPVYGRTFKLQDSTLTELGSPSKAQGTSSTGIRAYYDICPFVNDSRWTVKTPNITAMGPYAYRGEDWICFDDEAIVKRKAMFSVEQGMAGVMLWTLDNDDFRGDCGDKTYPLLKASREGLVDGLAALKAAATSTTTPTTTTTPPPTTTPTLTTEVNVLSEVVPMNLEAGILPRVLTREEVPSLRANITAIANKSASLAADILNLSNFSTTVLLDNSTGGERMARLDSVVFKEQKSQSDETIHTFQPQYGLELGGKLNQNEWDRVCNAYLGFLVSSEDEVLVLGSAQVNKPSN